MHLCWLYIELIRNLVYLCVCVIQYFETTLCLVGVLEFCIPYRLSRSIISDMEGNVSDNVESDTVSLLWEAEDYVSSVMSQQPAAVLCTPLPTCKKRHLSMSTESDVKKIRSEIVEPINRSSISGITYSDSRNGAS